MLRRILGRIWRWIRNFLLMMFNREFLIFLFFLALSGAFWLMLTLNENYEREVSVPVVITNVPRNAIITGTSVDTVRFTVRDKGYMIGAYVYGKTVRQITVDFAASSHADGTGRVSYAELVRKISALIYKSSKLVSVKPSSISFTYNYGQHKKLPVHILGSVRAAGSYYLSEAHFSPEVVSVYGSKHLLDSLSCVYTERLNISNITDTTRIEVGLRPIKGAKIVPSKVSLTLYPDVLIESPIDVQITAVNMPDGKVLRTFPQHVTVIAVCGSSQVRHLKRKGSDKDFLVVADYNDIMRNPSDKCKLVLRRMPGYVKSARLETSAVDYLIEQ